MTPALQLIARIRTASSWTHPARRGLGAIITRVLDDAVTDDDMMKLRDMLEAVSSK